MDHDHHLCGCRGRGLSLIDLWGLTAAKAHVSVAVVMMIRVVNMLQTVVCVLVAARPAAAQA